MTAGGSQISVERALRWVQAFAVREWALLVPVGLAFFALPRMILSVMFAKQAATLPAGTPPLQALQTLSANMPAWWTPMVIGILAASVVGAMVVMALALRPRISVGEAIVLAFRRLPVCLAVLVMMTVALFLIALVSMTLIDLIKGGQTAATAVIFLALIAIGFLLLLLLPVVLNQHGGPIAVLRQGWQLYNGHALRIIGGLIVFILGAWIIVLAVQVSVGSMLMVVGRMAGQKELGDLAGAIVVSLCAAVGWTGFYLLVASFYRQLVFGE